MKKSPYDPNVDSLRQLGAMDAAQELFVPVHGHVILYLEEIAIINHPAFQRLRRVRQLGLAHMVFPGATHTRFEHSVGAVHVAQMIIEHVNWNFRKSLQTTRSGPWEYCGVNYPTARYIRLGALLHDIGHLPYGHTLEDELHHLKEHDGAQRLSIVADARYEVHEVDRNLAARLTRPKGGWSLKELVNALYEPYARELGIENSPFELLTHIVCKPPKGSGASAKDWRDTGALLENSIDLGVCQDIVGNTICADFLDYLFRDWQHIGKPFYHDKRLYQYMEIRRLDSEEENQTQPPKFVINAGPREKVRHDALTDILDLLTARYKLAETVLFHRTKLALTGVLDRCLLELHNLFQVLALPEDELQRMLEALLLDSSDDGLFGVLKKLANGGTAYKQKLQEALKAEAKTLESQIAKTPTPHLYEKAETPTARGELQDRVAVINSLIERLKSREVYTLAYKLRISDFPGPHGPDNPRLKGVLALYNVPQNRLAFLSGLEARCGLPAGSLVMYCPPDAKMNAKIARVKLFIEGEVYPFDEYERVRGDSGLTGGALLAQLKRFYELWSAYIFVERTCWDGLSESARRNLQSVIECFFYQTDPDADLKIARSQVDYSIQTVCAETILAAFRSSFGNPPGVEKFENFKFPSGLPFGIDA